MQDQKHYMQVEEIAAPGCSRHFVGNIVKMLVKESVLGSAKGCTPGFAINEHALQLPLIRLNAITGGYSIFNTCVLCLKEGNAIKPCSLHHQMEGGVAMLKMILSGTVIGDLPDDKKPDFI